MHLQGTELKETDSKAYHFDRTLGHTVVCQLVFVEAYILVEQDLLTLSEFVHVDGFLRFVHLNKRRCYSAMGML